MPTLLSINNYYYRRAGAEAVFFEHNALFEKIGWQVLPFCMHHPLNLPSQWSEFFVDELEFGSEYSLWEKLAMATKVVYSLEARRKVDALITKVRPDIVHAHNLYHHISPSILGLLKARNLPVFLTLHDLKIACPAYKMLSHDGVCERCKAGHLSQVVVNRCVKDSLTVSALAFAEAVVHRWLKTYSTYVDRFIVPSRFYLHKLVEWGWNADRFVHIPNFVHTASLQPDFTPGSSFVYFGRLAPEKGLRTLVKASAMAKLKVDLIGTGPEEDDLRRLVAETGADVELHGFMSGNALYDLIRSARAVVLPSEWYENAPISLMEAYALGKPVIGAAIGGIPELILAGETGNSFVSGDAESLAAVMQEFAGLPEWQVEQMGRAGRQWMETDFSPDAYRERLLAIYRQFGAGNDF